MDGAVDEDERDDGVSSVEECAGGMVRRRSWTAAASRRTAAAGDDDESEREIEREMRNRSKSQDLYREGSLVPGRGYARY